MTHPHWQVNTPPPRPSTYPADTAFGRSWAILAASWRLVTQDRRLAAIAVLAGLAQVLAVAALLGVSTVLPGSWAVSIGLAGLLMAWPLQVVATTAGVVLTAAGLAALEGREVSLRAATRCAWERRWAILGWATLAAGVGSLLEQIADRVPFGGRLLVWLADIAWSVVTMFAVPVLVLEPGGPRHVVKRSVGVFRARWGEGLAGTVSLGFVVGLPLTVALWVVMAGVVASSIATIVVGAVLAAVGIVAAFAASTLFSLALYRWATGADEAAAQGPDDPGTLRGGLKLKERRGH